MGDVRYPHLRTQVPGPSVAHAHRFLGLPGNLASYLLKGLVPALIDQFPVELQVSHIGPLGARNVVEHLGAGEITVKREVAWDASGNGIVDQFDTQLGMVGKFPLLARLSFLGSSTANRGLRPSAL